MSIEKTKARFPNGQLRTSHPFYMADAIQDIPHCLEACLNPNLLNSTLEAMQRIKPERIFAVGCGTSYNACQTIAYASRTLLQTPAEAWDALDFKFDTPCDVDPRSLVISISHSGQTLETCLAQKIAKDKGAFTAAISGNPNSSLSKAADFTLTDPLGLEIPFGKTRSYLSSCLQGMLVAVMTAPAQLREEFIEQSMKMVASIRENMAAWEKSGRRIASQWAGRMTHYMLAGFGAQKSSADEIALKLIEVLGESATSYSLEEFTHGPHSSFRKDMGILLFQTDERTLERTLNIAKGIALSEAALAVITDQVGAGWPEKAQIIPLPTFSKISQLAFFPAAAAAQHLVYFLAVQKGLNPDINCVNLHPELEDIWDVLFPPGTH